MNRTIKFRGKCLHSDEWCFGSLVDYKDEEMEIQGFDVFCEGFDKWNEISVDPDTVGQFTGMYDCNGKEIYEGDILRTSISKNGIGFVRWNIENASFVVQMKNSAQWYDLWRGYEVIGNIYDNPELLKGGKK